MSDQPMIGIVMPRICRSSIRITIKFKTLPASLKLRAVRCSSRAPPRYIYLAIKNKFPIKINSYFSKPTILFDIVTSFLSYNIGI